MLVENQDSRFLLNINHDERAYRRYIRSGGERLRSAILIREPFAIYPKQFRSEILDKYGLVLGPGFVHQSRINSLKLPCPYTYSNNPNIVTLDEVRSNNISLISDKLCTPNIAEWKKRDISCSMIASNKVSATSHSNYALRRFLAKKFESEIAVFGDLWTSTLSSKIHHRLQVASFNLKSGYFPNLLSLYGNLFERYPHAQGQVSNKHAILKSSRFSIIIENDNFFCTEKIIDCMINGAIPVYLGSDPTQFGIPNNSYIDFSVFVHQIEHLTEILESYPCESLLENAYNYLTSSNFIDNWPANRVYSKLYSVIASFFGKTPND